MCYTYVMLPTFRIKPDLFAAQIRVSNMVARGTLRATVRPLLDELPVVGAVKASFVGAPTFSYDVNAYGIDPMFLPGLERYINGFILHTVLRPFTFPDVSLPSLPYESGSASCQRDPCNKVPATAAAGVCGASGRPPPRRDRGA